MIHSEDRTGVRLQSRPLKKYTHTHTQMLFEANDWVVARWSHQQVSIINYRKITIITDGFVWTSSLCPPEWVHWPSAWVTAQEANSIPLCARILSSSPGFDDFHLSIHSDMATVAKAMACPESGLEVRDRMWLKITIANAFIGTTARAEDMVWLSNLQCVSIMQFISLLRIWNDLP